MPLGCLSSPPTYIYVGRRRLEHTTSIVSRVRCPLHSLHPDHILAVLSEALRGSLHHHHHHAVMLTELIYFLETFLDQEFEGRHRADCVLNSEVSYVRYLIGRNKKKFDYINHVVKRFLFRSTRVRRQTLTLPPLLASLVPHNFRRCIIPTIYLLGNVTSNFKKNLRSRKIYLGDA